MRRLPQSTAYTVMLKLFLSSDHVSAATGKTVAIKISKNGGAFADPNAGATNATEVSNGWYKVTLDTTDTGTLGDLVVRGTATSCDDSEQVCQVVKATNGGLTALPDAAAEAAGGLYTRGSGAGQINQDANGRVDVNLKAILGTVLTETAGQIAAGFKKLFDVASPVFTLASINQTGDAYGRIGANGGGLTALGDARIAHLDADVSTRLATSGYTAPPSAATIAQAVWDALTSALTTVGSIGKLLVTNIDAAITSRSSHSAADVWGVTTRRLSDGTNIVLTKGTGVTGFNDLDAAGIRGALGLLSANLDNQIATLATAAGLSDLSDGVSATFTSLASWGDAHWSTATGFATVNPDNAGIAAIQERTDNLPDDPADASVVAASFSALQSHGDGAWATGAPAPTAEAIADEVQTRTIAAVTTVANRVDANMRSINGTELTGDGSAGDKFGPA